MMKYYIYDQLDTYKPYRGVSDQWMTDAQQLSPDDRKHLHIVEHKDIIPFKSRESASLELAMLKDRRWHKRCMVVSEQELIIKML